MLDRVHEPASEGNAVRSKRDAGALRVRGVGAWHLRRARPWVACLAALTMAAGLSVTPALASAAQSAPAVVTLSPAFGPSQGGTQVEIDGTGFVGVTGVLFGGESAPFVVDSSSLILAFAPAAPVGGGSVPVRVVTSAGTSAPAPYTYVGVPAVSGLYPQSGPVAGGVAVTISGSGFAGATAVNFGAGRSAKFTVVSNTEIEAELPPDTTLQQQQRCAHSRCRTVHVEAPASSALTVDVTVVTPAGSSAPGTADQFTYLPSPVVTSVAPATGPASGGTPVTIAGSGFTGAVSVTFGGTPATFQVVSDGEIQATAPPGSGTATVQVAAGPSVGSVAVGGDTAYAIQSGGSLWQWGLRAPLPAAAAASPPACACATLPEQVSGVGPVTAVAAGTGATYALAADGTVWAWGTGGQGQLGDGHLADRAVPVRVSGLSHVVGIAAGSAGGLALESNGSVWAWGGDISGQLGSLAAWSRPCLCSDVPVQVPGLPAVHAIASGGLTGYALTASGSVWAWGGGADGQLGVGARRDIAAPQAIPGLGGITQVVAGRSSAYALGGDGTVWAWGADGHGELGQLDVTPYAACACVDAPAAVAGLPQQVASLAAGRDTAYALTAGGTVWAWGNGGNGQLGQTVASGASPAAGGLVCACTTTPVQVPGLVDVTFLAAGGNTALALGGGGALVGWGDGADGQLGPTTQSSSNQALISLPFWSDASAAGPSAAFTYVSAAALASPS